MVMHTQQRTTAYYTLQSTATRLFNVSYDSCQGRCSSQYCLPADIRIGERSGPSNDVRHRQVVQYRMAAHADLTNSSRVPALPTKLMCKTLAGHISRRVRTSASGHRRQSGTGLVAKGLVVEATIPFEVAPARLLRWGGTLG